MAIQAPYGMAQSQSPPSGMPEANAPIDTAQSGKPVACCTCIAAPRHNQQVKHTSLFTLGFWSPTGCFKSPRRLRKVCLLLGWSAVFPAVSSWLDSPLHRVRANSPESKLLEEVMRLIKPQGRRELFKAPSMKTGKPPVVRLLSGAACCQAAIRYCSCHGYFRSCLSINSLGYCSISSAFLGRPSKIAD